MLVIPMLSGILILALVLFETQNLMKAIFFAVDWPGNIRVSGIGDKLTVHVGAPLERGSRWTMGTYRWAYTSLLLHELHCWRLGRPAEFKVWSSAFFGALVATGLLVSGVPEESVVALSVCATGVVFFSSQVRALARFYALRAEHGKQLAKLLTNI